MKNSAVERALLSIGRMDNREYDLPYLAGYSEDGETIYFDRHLPDKLDAVQDGQNWVFDPHAFIRLHEETEKALIMALGWRYGPAHQVANAVERRAVLAAGIPWLAYERAVEPYIKADAKEKLKVIPPDLDWAPYYFPPINRTLIKRMQVAQGQEKLDKDDASVNYSPDRGKPTRHCGPDNGWPEHYCEYFRQNSCTKVLGYIEPRGGCDLFQEAKY
jgi:hypothetical protein